MSYWAAYYGEALVLNKEEFDEFLQNYSKKHCLDKETMFDKENLSEYGFLNSKNDGKDFTITEVNPDWCDGMYFIPYYCANGDINITIFGEDGNITKAIKADNLRFETSYVIFADRSRLGIKSFFDPPYATYDALKQEFVDKLEAYLPDYFDYNSHIGDFSYACYA